MSSDQIKSSLEIFIELIPFLISLFIKNNINNLQIPSDYNSFNKNYEHKIDKILRNILLDLVNLFDEIKNVNNEQNDPINEQKYSKESIKMLKLYETFFIKIRYFNEISEKKKFIKIYYSKLYDLKKGITNDILLLFVLSIVIIVLNFSFLIKENLILIIIIILLIILINLFIKIITSYFNYKKFEGLINDSIGDIEEKYNDLPRLGDGFNNEN